ncbi:MAG: histidine phosphatase family protein [Bacteroidales bacterium]|nr:histidine phosphatase family protein [Bacteroidales bacterium]
MKRIYLLRHAKASWNDDVDDKDRIISYIGVNEAKKVAAEIVKKEIKFDKIISSPAKRAYQTADIIKNKIGFIGEIVLEESFYFDYQREILNFIQNIDNKVDSVLLVGHNPTWSKLAGDFSDERVYLDTANLAALNADINDWNEAVYGIFNLDYVISPNNL